MKKCSHDDGREFRRGQTVKPFPLQVWNLTPVVPSSIAFAIYAYPFLFVVISLSLFIFAFPVTMKTSMYYLQKPVSNLEYKINNGIITALYYFTLYFPVR